MSNLDAKTEAWLSGASAALEDITASPLSRNSQSDRSSLSAEIAAALNSGVSQIMRVVSNTSSISESPTACRSSNGHAAPSPRFSSHPSRSRSAKRVCAGERSFGLDRTNSLAANESSGLEMDITKHTILSQQPQQPQQQRLESLSTRVSPTQSVLKISPPPRSPATE